MSAHTKEKMDVFFLILVIRFFFKIECVFLVDDWGIIIIYNVDMNDRGA